MKPVQSLLLLSFLLIMIVGCANENATPQPPTAAVAAAVPTFSTRDLPVMFTPVPTTAPVTPSPPPTATPRGPTATPIDFSQTAVELRYAIPSLGLERRLQGNIASQIIFVDETTGKALQRSNQGGILLELQNALPEMILEPLPDGCDTCVYVEYDLPLAEEEGAGWLRDPVLLASIENLMAIVLDPHFPPGTLAGLRRSASPYAPAHSVAVLEDGSVYTWLATEGQVSAAITTAVSLPSLLATIAPESLAGAYTTTCPGVPVETLSLTLDATTTSIDIICPEFTLPTTLQPLYLELDAFVADKLTALDGPQRPPSGFPLAGVLDYRRSDGARLTLFADGRARVVDATGEIFTTTLPISRVMSTTTGLIESGLVQPGLATYFAETEETEAAASHLLVRGTAGVYDARWTGTETAVAPLDDLLANLANAAAAGTPTPQATTELEGTAAADDTAEEAEETETVTPAETPTLTPTLPPPTPTP